MSFDNKNLLHEQKTQFLQRVRLQKALVAQTDERPAPEFAGGRPGDVGEPLRACFYCHFRASLLRRWQRLDEFFPTIQPEGHPLTRVTLNI